MTHRTSMLASARRLAGLRRQLDRTIDDRLVRTTLVADHRAATRVMRTVARGRPDADGWVVLGGRRGDPAILIVGPAGGPPTAVLRLAAGAAAAAGLEASNAALAILQERLAGPIREIVPRPIGSGSLAGRAWAMETALPGHSGRGFIDDAATRRQMLIAATEAIAAIHQATARPVVVDERMVEGWIDRRVDLVARILDPSQARLRTALERAAAAMTGDLRGATVVTGWIHGDLWPANVLVEGTPTIVTGIIDWDSAADDEPGFHDLAHLALTTRRLVEHRDLGPVLGDILRGSSGWDADAAVVLDGPQPPWSRAVPVAPWAGLPQRTGLLLYWLRFVESNVVRHPRLAGDRSWRAANIESVLACV